MTKINVQTRSDDWIELFPYGVSLSFDEARPFLILKDDSESEVLPVWMSALDAGMAVAESDVTSTHQDAHKLSALILKKFELQVKDCRFIDIQGHHQFVEISVQGPDSLEKITVRADEAMSYCLSAKARFFAKRSLMLASRRLNERLSPKAETQVKTLPISQSYLM